MEDEDNNIKKDMRILYILNPFGVMKTTKNTHIKTDNNALCVDIFEKLLWVGKNVVSLRIFTSCTQAG